MSFLGRYLWEHAGVIALQLVFVGIFAGVFRLYHLPLAAVLYPAGLCLLLGCLFAGRAAFTAYQRHKKLAALRGLGGNALRTALPEPATARDRDYQRLILNLCGELQETGDKAAGDYREMLDYFTVWVHQIKTPIASMRLQLAAEDSPLSRRLKSELLHIEQYVEMVLTYFRMGADSTDYLFRAFPLDALLRENIRKFRGDFILKKLELVYTPTELVVTSDEKWLSFVVEQLLSNALKYTNEGAVTISVEAPATLCIRDTGIGIAPEDLPRIFQEGYTGGNGRADKRASGLGLYLCRRICGRLGHTLSAVSEVEAGTTIKIDLSRYKQVSE